MSSEDGAFYSATDADSEGHEGLFFVWTPTEIAAVVGSERAKVVAAYYDVTERGNFEGRNILHRPRPEADVARSLGVSPAELQRTIEEVIPLLYQARKARIAPLLDDKIITEWNGQAISAFARAGFALGEPRYLKAAERAAEFILSRSTNGGRLQRTFRAGQARHPAVLEDLAFTIAGLLDLFEADPEPKWLTHALELEATLERHHLDPAGGFFSSADDAEAMLIREKPSYDGAQPSGNSVAAQNLLRFAELTDQPRFKELAQKTLVALSGQLDGSALAAPKLAAALDFYLDRPRQIVLVARRADELSPLLDVLRKSYLPNKVLVAVEEGPRLEALRAMIPLLEGKHAIGGRPTAYVCTQRVCQRPVHTPEELAQQLAHHEPFQPAPRPLAAIER
jgi:uncharacterized protein YyaL (SSP411 family)